MDNAIDSVAGAVPLTVSSRPAIPARHFRRLLTFHVIVLTLASWVLVAVGSSDEPYVSFHAVDAVTQLGVGCVLIVLWLYVITAILYGVWTGRISRWWLLVLPWSALVLFYLRLCPLVLSKTSAGTPYGSHYEPDTHETLPLTPKASLVRCTKIVERFVTHYQVWQ